MNPSDVIAAANHWANLHHRQRVILESLPEPLSGYYWNVAQRAADAGVDPDLLEELRMIDAEVSDLRAVFCRMDGETQDLWFLRVEARVFRLFGRPLPDDPILWSPLPA